MQEALGTDFTDFTDVSDVNWSARLSPDDSAIQRGPHFLPLISFGLRASPWRVDLGPASLGARSSTILSSGYLWRALSQTGKAIIRAFQFMIIDCLCVCHPRFQNEVIGGETYGIRRFRLHRSVG